MIYQRLAMGWWNVLAKAKESEANYCMLCNKASWPEIFRAGFWPHRYRENTEMGPPAGRRRAGGSMLRIS